MTDIAVNGRVADIASAHGVHRVGNIARIGQGGNARSDHVKHLTESHVVLQAVAVLDVAQIKILHLRDQIIGFLFLGRHQRNGRQSAVDGIIVKHLALITALEGIILRERQRKNVNLVASALKLGQNIL